MRKNTNGPGLIVKKINESKGIVVQERKRERKRDSLQAQFFMYIYLILLCILYNT